MKDIKIVKNLKNSNGELKRALVLAGGGVKGVSSLNVLAKIEDEIKIPIYEHYDLMAGSSVGAITAALMATGVISANEYFDIFSDAAKTIFKKHWFPFKFPKYDRKNFRKVWSKILGDKKDMLFGEVKTKLIITSVDLVTDQTKFFKSWHKDDAKLKLIDVVERSFAAPVFFGKIIDEKARAVWSDGGITSENLPLDIAFYEGLKNNWFHYNNKMFHIDAIGCLIVKKDKKDDFNKVKKFRTIREILDFSKIGSGGMARTSAEKDIIKKMKYLMSAKSNTLSIRYFEAEIPKKMDGLDKLNLIPYYREKGYDMIKNYIDL